MALKNFCLAIRKIFDSLPEMTSQNANISHAFVAFLLDAYVFPGTNDIVFSSVQFNRLFNLELLEAHGLTSK